MGFSISQTFTTLANLGLGSDLSYRKRRKVKNVKREIGKAFKIILSLGKLMCLQVLVEFE